MKLRLLADDNGRLRENGIQLNDRTFADFEGLHAYIRSVIGDDAGPGSVDNSEFEIEIDCDYHLRYAHAIDAVTAVTGYVDADENVVKLIEKIRFSPPKPR